MVVICLLDKYKNVQTVAYNMLNNAISNNKLSHAYLIDSNGNSDALDISLSFAKMIICNEIEDNLKKETMERIDNGNYLDIKVIDSDGMWIKKDELIELQNEFSKKSIEGRKKVYIIKEAEKMNVMTANSLLKFLEEPVDDIVAILLVNDISLILPTIISRCQIIKLSKKELYDSTVSNFYDLFYNSKYGKISSEEVNVIIDNVINFVLVLEINGIDTLIYEKKMWHNFFKDREANLIGLELLIYFYEDILKYKCGSDSLFFYDRKKDISKVSDNNDIDKISRKLKILIENVGNLKYNLNINLFIDKLIIDMCGDLL